MIFVPIFLPLLDHFGIDPLFFGLLIALNIQTSFLSPPVAMAPFYLKGVAPKEVSINDIFAGVMPFIFIVIGSHGAALHLPADRPVAAEPALRALAQRALKCIALEGEKLPRPDYSGASFASQAIPLARPML